MTFRFVSCRSRSSGVVVSRLLTAGSRLLVLLSQYLVLFPIIFYNAASFSINLSITDKMALGTFRHSFFRLPDANTANSTSHILRKNQGFYRCVGHRRHINTSRHHGTATVTTAASLISGSSSSPMVPAKNDSRSETTVQSTLSPQRTLQSLSLLPFSSLLRGWVISAVTSSPAFLPLSIWLLRTVAYTKSPVLSADSNPIVRWLLKKTIYAQFCAGENVSEVKATIAQLRKQGVDGVLLGCGKELEVRRENAADEGKVESKHALAMERENDDAELEVKEWERCTLETIAMAPEGDFVSIKYIPLPPSQYPYTSLPVPLSSLVSRTKASPQSDLQAPAL